MRVPAGKSVDLTCVRSAVGPLTPPYLRLTGFPRRVGHVSGSVVRGREDVATRSTSAISFPPPSPGKTFSRCPIRVLKMRYCAKSPAYGDVRLVPSGGLGTDRTERSSGEELAGLRIREDLTERVNSGTNPGDLAERANSSTNPGDLAERVNSDTNLENLVERVNSGTSPRDLAERANSGTDPRDSTKRVNSGTNLGDLTERMNSGTNPRDLAERVLWVVSSPGSGEASRCDLEVGSSGASSGPPSPVDMRVLRDLEVMKANNDLDTAVTKGSLTVIRERYNIPVEYGLHVPQPGQRPYSSDAPGMCISGQGGYYLTARIDFRVSGAPSNNKGWKSRYPFVSGPVWGFRLNWSAYPIGNASPYLSKEESVLVGRLKGILSSSRVIKEMIKLWLVEAGLSPTSRGTVILPYFNFSSCILTCKSGCRSNDPDELHGMPKVSNGKAPPTRPAAREVGASPAREAPKASSKRPVDAPTEQADDAARRHKKIKVLTRRYKSRLGEGESCSQSKGKEPATPSEEPETPAESEEEGASPAHRRPRSMKDLFKTKVHKDDAGYYTLLMSDLGHQHPEKKEMKARWKGLKNSRRCGITRQQRRSSRGDFSTPN
ncbi:hypothetical protein B296_00005149 [Ensete ventricosum]|uniref:Uncharacterized protein n=1 Tax=Ensete ventricosum TaxID=4639 RepID=A0A426ZE09_ENSVE|nr:hypothetical protein B296_00005149 [Ensete ventricosum]